MGRRGAWRTGEDDSGRLSPCVCNTLRMVTRVVTQLYDDMLRPSGLRVTQFSILAAIGGTSEMNLKQLENALSIDQTTLTRSLALLGADGLVERAEHSDGRIKAMRLTVKGRRTLEAARPLWAQAQRKVLRKLGRKAWADAQRRLTHLHHVAAKRRRRGPDERSGPPGRAPKRARRTRAGVRRAGRTATVAA